MRRMLNLMVGELNASHSGVGGPRGGAGPITGRIGLRFDRAEYEANGRLKVASVDPVRRGGDRRREGRAVSRRGGRAEDRCAHEPRRAAREHDRPARCRCPWPRAPTGRTRARSPSGRSMRRRRRRCCTASGSRSDAPTSRRRAAADSATSTCSTWAPARSRSCTSTSMRRISRVRASSSTCGTTTAAS